MKLHIARIGMLLLLSPAMTSCVHIGQRHLHIEIELDGQVVFEGMRGVNDNMPVEQMWRVLDDVPFKMTAGYLNSLGSTDIQTHTLNGKVLVRIKHVDRQLAIASLSSLSLSRDSTGSWLLDDGETGRVEQNAKANVLPNATQ